MKSNRLNLDKCQLHIRNWAEVAVINFYSVSSFGKANQNNLKSCISENLRPSFLFSWRKLIQTEKGNSMGTIKNSEPENNRKSTALNIQKTIILEVICITFMFNNFFLINRSVYVFEGCFRVFHIRHHF